MKFFSVNLRVKVKNVQYIKCKTKKYVDNLHELQYTIHEADFIDRVCIGKGGNMRKILIKGISSLLAVTLLFAVGGIALAAVVEYSDFAKYQLSHVDYETANDTATGTVTLQHQDVNGKYWGYVRANVTITGVERDGKQTWSVSGDTKQLETYTVSKKVTGKTPYGRSATAVLTARCRHNTTCTNKGEVKKTLKETW